MTAPLERKLPGRVVASTPVAEASPPMSIPGNFFKLCSKCGKTKPGSEFEPGRAKCKPCRAMQASAYCKANPDKNRARGAKWRKANRDKHLATRARWYKANTDKVRAIRARWRETHLDEARAASARRRKTNPDKVRAELARWYKANTDKVRATNARWRKANPDRARVLGARWQKNNPEKRRVAEVRRRALKAKAQGADYTTAEHIRKRWEMYGSCCYMCGAPATTTDHVIPLARGGGHWPANLRPACGPCNTRKGSVRYTVSELKSVMNKRKEQYGHQT